MYTIEELTIQEVFDSQSKSEICRSILSKMPPYIELNFSINTYRENVVKYPFFMASYQNEVIGFISLISHNPYNTEIYCLAVLSKYHRQGVGSLLLERAREYGLNHRKDYLSLKAIAPENENDIYASNIEFYEDSGFIPLESFINNQDLRKYIYMIFPI